MKDMVNSPAHYNQTELECIDAIKYALGEEGFVAYCRGNAIKYNWRAGHKIDSVEDLNKAAWYCRMAAGDDPRKDPNYKRGAPKKDIAPRSDEERREARVVAEQALVGPCQTDAQSKVGHVVEICVHKRSNCYDCGLTNEIDLRPGPGGVIVPTECDNRGGA
jgi:hypothetical protein